ncbi:MAG: hypothetical protein CVV49_21670, partial [Spirochaetae bacterium HGW-Spirochaetae-5]
IDYLRGQGDIFFGIRRIYITDFRVFIRIDPCLNGDLWDYGINMMASGDWAVNHENPLIG